MKKFILVIFALFIPCVGINSQIIDKWSIIDTSKGNYHEWYREYNFSALNAKNLAVIGSKYSNTGHYIKITDDAGISWNKILQSKSFQYHFYGVAYPEKNILFVIGDSIQYQGYDNNYYEYYKRWGLIYKSFDNGVNWEKIVTDSNSFFNWIKMIDKNTGIANKRILSNRYNCDLIYGDTLFYTEDGFNHYELIPVPDNRVTIEEAYIFNKNSFIICGISKYHYYMYSTKDKGKTWDIKFLGTDAVKAFFYTDKIGFLITKTQIDSNSKTKICLIKKTTDGGETWTNCDYPKDINWSADYQNISFFDENNAMAFGNNNAILRTRDGGKTWVEEFAPDIFEYDQRRGTFYYSVYPAKDTVYAMLEDHIIRSSGEKTLDRPKFYLDYNRQDINNNIVTWTPVIAAEKYQFQFFKPDSDYYYEPSDFDNKLMDIETSDTSVIIPNTEYNQCYYAKVIAKMGNYESGWYVGAPVFCTFKNDSFTYAPSFIEPKHGQIINYDTVDIIWNSSVGADYYQLQVCDNPYYWGKNLLDFKNLFDTSLIVKKLILNHDYYARVKILSGDKISEWQSLYFRTGQLSSVDENSIRKSDFVLYPNPANDKIAVSLINQKIDRDKIIISIIDLSGRLVKSFKQFNIIDNISFDFDISDINIGTYFLKLESGTDFFMKKFDVIR
jgi:photosystem II stability/assembly factor-like uncharacterized protein